MWPPCQAASAQSGEAITRGLAIAIDEINAKGGVLGGRKLELVHRDDELVPPKGVVAARELISKEKVVAMFGGIDTPVALATVPVVNKEKVPYMAVWAAGTGITRNGADPNFVFRVAVDVLVDVKLLDYASKKFGSKKPGLMLINNPWGASNEQGLVAADKDNAAVEIAGIEKFENNDVDMTPQLTRLKEKGAELHHPRRQHPARRADDEGRAMPARLRMPPDSSAGNLTAASGQAGELDLQHRQFGHQLRGQGTVFLQRHHHVLSTVSDENKAPFWNSTPVFRSMYSRSRARGDSAFRPSTSIEPLCGLFSARMLRISTDLPEPEPPTTPMISPAGPAGPGSRARCNRRTGCPGRGPR